MQRPAERAFRASLNFQQFPHDAVRSSKAQSRGQRPYTNVRRGEWRIVVGIFCSETTSFEAAESTRSHDTEKNSVGFHLEAIKYFESLRDEFRNLLPFKLEI